MKYQTTIDTVSLKIDFIFEDTRDVILEGILALYTKDNFYIAHKEYPINQHSNFYISKHHVYSNNVVIASIGEGSFSVKSRVTNDVITTYYISLEFAGLMRYNQVQDTISNNILVKTCAYLNTRHIVYGLNGLDVCMDLYTEFDNVLALCTKKSPKTEYYMANEPQPFATTSYIEKVPYGKHSVAVQRSYLYDKSEKENLAYNLTRFEVKLQSKFFSKNRDNVILGIINALEKYHVMYVPLKAQKNHLMQQYDMQTTLRQRDIKRLKLDSYKCYPDISAVAGFINHLFSVQEREVFMNV